MTTLTITDHHRDRIIDAVAHAGGDPTRCQTVVEAIPPAEPTRLQAALQRVLPAQVIVAGTLERRLLLAQHPDRDRWTVADLAGEPHDTRRWPTWAHTNIDIDDMSSWVSTATLSPGAVHRLTRPRVLLAALYHPEFFPLPRFPLAISDLARAARSALTGQVGLLDMQLDATLADIHAAVRAERADVVGISATFGQHDLLIELLDAITDLPSRPLVLAGGSLTARNEKLLLDRYPWLLIARGAGEPTIADVLAYWHGDLELSQVRGIGYVGAPRGAGALPIGHYRKTATVANQAQTDIYPELDLLPATFAHRRVAQLETSRGCTNFCSFCPRGHKGSWSGAGPSSLSWIIQAIGEVFDAHPEVSRTLYLVDEEFIGRGPDAVRRALAVAAVLHAHRFQWETSCRIDQVVQPGSGRDWHLERARMWRQLRERGLRRCLFGVESGVTSILARFNKETSGEQNALAIRTLTALGIPTRFTYITFDHLMTPGELRGTCHFQGRRDLLLRPLPHLDLAQIIDGVRDEDFVAEHTTNEPFYTGISYLLVSMECLIGAAYTKQVQAAGLAGPARPAMGRLDAEFADWRIGRFSHHAQLWVDRHFALDYTLKSLEKVLDGPQRHAVRDARLVLKDAAFALLDAMVALLDQTPLDQSDHASLDTTLVALMNAQNTRLRTRMETAIGELGQALRREDAALLHREYDRWAGAQSWTLINAADPCGT
jgi:hypothetical protein